MSKPFARANQMMALIAAAMAIAEPSMQQAALAKIAPYESRGKGKGGGNRVAPGAVKRFQRAAMKKRRVAAHKARG